MNKFGERVKQLRKKGRYTQRHLIDFLSSQGIAVSQSHLSKIESGDRQPSMEIQEALADFFNVSLDYLYGKESRTPRLIDPLEPGQILSDDESEVISHYRSLNSHGQRLARDQLREIAGTEPLRRGAARADDDSCRKQGFPDNGECGTPTEFRLLAASGSEGLDEDGKAALKRDIERIERLKGKGDGDGQI